MPLVSENFEGQSSETFDSACLVILLDPAQELFGLILSALPQSGKLIGLFGTDFELFPKPAGKVRIFGRLHRKRPLYLIPDLFPVSLGLFIWNDEETEAFNTATFGNFFPVNFDI